MFGCKMLTTSVLSFGFVLLFTALPAVAETRDEFRAKVRDGMSQTEVVKKLGKPDHIHDDEKEIGVTYYYYFKRTRDPGSDQQDRYAGISFHDGRLIRVHFQR
jgi:hypothetical protein